MRGGSGRFHGSPSPRCAGGKGRDVSGRSMRGGSGRDAS